MQELPLTFVNPEVKYSVIVPAYNAEHTIAPCLNALMRQSVGEAEYEVIVVDDGSSDGTSGIVSRYPVKYLHQPNAGPASARNRGARAASGEIILFTDSDCVPSQNWIEEMVRPFSDPAVAAVKGAYKTSQVSFFARFSQIEFEERFAMLEKAESIDMVDTYSAAYRREVFWEMGGFDVSFPVANNEDTDLSYKLSAAGKKMIFAPGAIVFHLNHPSTLIRYARVKFWRGYWRMVVYKRFPGKMVKDTYTPQSLKFQILFLFLSLFLLFIAPIFRTGILILPLTLLAFIISTLQFAVFAIGRDKAVGVLAPFFLSVRALVIGGGILYFFLKGNRA